MHLAQIKLRKSLCFAVLFLLWTHALNSPAHSQSPSERIFLKVGVSDNNLFFTSLLPRLMKNMGSDYVQFHKPFNRSVWSLAKGKIHIAGPFPKERLTLYANEAGIALNSIQRLPIIVDRRPIFAIYADKPISMKAMKTAKDLSISLTSNIYYNPQENSQRLFRVKGLAQAVKLLNAGRVDIALVSKKELDQLKKRFSNLKLGTSHRPIYFQNEYLFINKNSGDFSAKLAKAYEELTRTDYYDLQWERFSEEKEWRN
ncbi:exported hypothetical protein [Candidatus Terasakiella magnetica]|uniref:Solute-binding protein family 3/N-terminal domain-containing protein n=1 Tax=Candidatus Terasakiella magnetica TaxID=1867952 RepID=A0A1C3RK90_9PROT|nr:hypothetical protein [Candidatus Terasakiella magnetica]SCA57663.1 exported hypothetical protein [Candidatus Terasakiella magnetica]